MSRWFPGASRALLERRAAVVERWLAAYARSPIRLPRPLDLRELQPVADLVAEALGMALSEPDCVPGAPSLREAEKRVAFVGGTMGQNGASAFEVAALMLALRDVLQEDGEGPDEVKRLGTLFDWLGAVSAEGYVVSRADALRLRHREALEKGTPVIMVTPDLPAALLLGEPDAPVVDAALGRLLLCAVRVGAKAVIMDLSGLMGPDSPVLFHALSRFGEEARIAKGLVVVGCQVPEALRASFHHALGPNCQVTFEERFEDAVATALSRAGAEGPTSPES